MAYKIVIIGGGSYNWTPTIAKDLFLQKSLHNSELMLVDIDPVRLKHLHKYCEFLDDKIRNNWTVSSSNNLDRALDSADAVILTISVGGLDAMQLDWDIPEKYGIYHTVADTLGPGGISRTLRNVPVVTGIVRKMEQHCPNAWLINITNPLTQIVEAVYKTSSIKCVGLCHNFVAELSFFSQMFKIPVEEIDAEAVGTNHFSFFTRLEHNGRNLILDLTMENYLAFADGEKDGGLQDFKTGTTDDIINEAVGHSLSVEHYLNTLFLERFGYYPVGAAPHVAENFPYFINDMDYIKKFRIRRKGVLPIRKQGMLGQRDKILRQMAGKEELELTSSAEDVSEVIAGLLTGDKKRIVVNMPNRGELPDLPENAVLEAWGNIDTSGICFEPVNNLPRFLVGLLVPAIESKRLSVDAAIEGDMNKLRQAFLLDPTISNIDIIDPLINDLLEAHKKYLPQFKTHSPEVALAK